MVKETGMGTSPGTRPMGRENASPPNPGSTDQPEAFGLPMMGFATLKVCAARKVGMSIPSTIRIRDNRPIGNLRTKFKIFKLVKR